jgi:ElaB/YqjD/DUF883 family membrane-anchored ribosome-binding protein
MRTDRLVENLESFRDQVAQKWSKFTKQDLAGIEADAGSLASTLAKRYSLSTKDARDQAEEFLSGLGTSFREAAQAIGDAATDLWRNGRAQVSEVVSSGADRVTEMWQSGRDQANTLCKRVEKSVAQQPLTSLAIAAGAGALLMLWLRRR